MIPWLPHGRRVLRAGPGLSLCPSTGRRCGPPGPVSRGLGLREGWRKHAGSGLRQSPPALLILSSASCQLLPSQALLPVKVGQWGAWPHFARGKETLPDWCVWFRGQLATGNRGLRLKESGATDSSLMAPARWGCAGPGSLLGVSPGK